MSTADEIKALRRKLAALKKRREEIAAAIRDLHERIAQVNEAGKPHRRSRGKSRKTKK